MKRRDFIALMTGAAAWPLAAHAQQPTRIARIGYLGLGPASAWSKRVEALRAGLRNLGWVEGKNLVIEFRWADGVDQLPGLAAELVRINVDAIFASSSTMVEPASKATKTIPIVFSNHADPIGTGHVASLNRPGGNITGLSELATELDAKALEMLKEAVPQAKHLASAVSVEEFDGALASMTREHVGGVFVVPSPLTLMERARLAQLALRYRLPMMFAAWENVEAGGLMSYGVDRDDLVRRAAVYIDKILKGAKPADLPVEQASKYQLVINLKSAKALDLEIPPTLLARADEVIE
jgi:putative tryptophan/tyrosine transport system substrate-binding protein